MAQDVITCDSNVVLDSVRVFVNGYQLETDRQDAICEEIRSLIGRGGVDELVIDGPGMNGTLHYLVGAARQAGRPVRLLAAIPEAELPPANPGECWVRQRRGARPTWLLSGPRTPRWKLAVKRAIDLVGALALIVLLSPLLVALAMVVRLSSAGPIFYRWQARGRNGRPFTAYKFRTMVRDADARKAELLAYNYMLGPVFKLAEDPRVTRAGRWLRRYSLDELPQLWNVLKGEMSLVGPRPPHGHEYVQFELWQMRKLSVTPGLTCLWQVNGRNRIRDFGQWARLDLDYIDHWSLRLDFSILLRTVGAVIAGTGW
jgi:lipopolysaccharide/colanic/teichoic acid biosynthesis glycosyltransferase